MEAMINGLSKVQEELANLSSLMKCTHQVQNEILTYEKTMEILDCSRNTLDRLRAEGVIKVYRLRGSLYCKYSEIMMALEQNMLDAA